MDTESPPSDPGELGLGISSLGVLVVSSFGLEIFTPGGGWTSSFSLEMVQIVESGISSCMVLMGLTFLLLLKQLKLSKLALFSTSRLHKKETPPSWCSFCKGKV